MPLESTVNNEDLLDVVNHAIDNEGELPPEDDTDPDAPAGDEGEGEGDGAGDGDDDPAGDGEGDGEGGVDPESETDAEGNKREHRPDGTFKSDKEIADEAAAKAAADAKAGDGKGNKPDAAKKPDPVNDPIPKDLKQETQTRMRSLISMTKEATQRAEQATADFNMLVSGVQAVGATPEQYGEMLSFLGLFNSNDPAQQLKALELAESFAERLSTLLGKERTIVDPLEAHADLKDAVAKGLTTKQFALEVARNRNQSNFRTELTTQQRQQQEGQQAFEREQQEARNALNQLEATLSKTDPHWAAKKAQLVPILKPIFAAMRPSQWPAAFQQAYKDMVFSAPVKKQSIPKNQPIRAGKGNPGGGSGGGLNKAAGSALDAMNEALGSM